MLCVTGSRFGLVLFHCGIVWIRLVSQRNCLDLGLSDFIEVVLASTEVYRILCVAVLLPLGRLLLHRRTCQFGLAVLGVQKSCFNQ